jgi:5-methylcytosine-specific restriction enzyme A
MRSHRDEFDKKTKIAALERSGKRCEQRVDLVLGIVGCGLKFVGIPEFDHIVPVALGGDNSLTNCQVLCRKCHRFKSDHPRDGDKSKIAKADRVREKHSGIRKSKYKWGKRPMRNPVRD